MTIIPASDTVRRIPAANAGIISHAARVLRVLQVPSDPRVRWVQGVPQGPKEFLAFGDRWDPRVLKVLPGLSVLRGLLARLGLSVLRDLPVSPDLPVLRDLLVLPDLLVHKAPLVIQDPLVLRDLPE